MTYEDTKKILTILKINYPHSFRGWKKEQGCDFLDLWAEAFKDDPVEIVVAAVKAIIYSDTREFAPNIGQVKDKMFKLSNPVQIDADEAWNMVSKALRNGIYGSEEEFAKLPPEVQVGVGSPSQLREWAMMDSDTVQSVIGSNFKKGYRGRVEAKKEYDKLPCETKNMIERLTNGMKMIE
ncbi:replicative helicase loader/inhibitor [Longicatena caecimuris]|uniref:replicative helicase loader/inhibitor n=1 Tax=Longicatena caecimuris TaxID=1796635 RepID=UPI0018AA0ECD|nr:replicative helicase loader/inhibitor [Longicatena caecimuris]